MTVCMFVALTRIATAADWTPGWSAWATISLRSGHFGVRAGDGTVLIGGGVVNGSVSATADRYEQLGRGWVAAASLKTARAEASATTLVDGRVLVVGGKGASNAPLASAELYNPATDSWTPAGAMAIARRSHSAVLLADGRVLVAGGFDAAGGPIAHAELYDPQTNAWGTGGDMTTARALTTATRLADGHVLVAGGVATTGTSGSAEVFDPATRSWSPAGGLKVARYRHTATLLPSGRVLVAGGSTDSGMTASAEIYDPAANGWTAATSMPSARTGQSAVTLRNGQVLLVGGTQTAPNVPDTSTTYDEPSHEWLFVDPMVSPHPEAVSVLLPNGRVLVVGGNAAQYTVEQWTPTTRLKVASSVWDVGSQAVSSTGPLRQIVVTNTGDQTLFVGRNDLTVTGSPANEFTAVPGGCTGASVEPGDQCMLGVRFSPAGTGVRRATFVFGANTTQGIQTIDLKGTGVAPASSPTPEPSASPEPTAAAPEPTPTATPAPDPPAPAVTLPAPRVTATPAPAAKSVRIVFSKAYRVTVKQRAAYCRGKVSLELRRGKAVLDRTTAKLDANCRFGATFTVGWSRVGSVKTLTVVAHFHGNRHFGATTNRFVVPVPKRG